MCLEIKLLKSLPHLPGANELKHDPITIVVMVFYITADANGFCMSVSALEKNDCIVM